MAGAWRNLGCPFKTDAGAGGLAEAMILLAKRDEHGRVLGRHLFGARERLARQFKIQISGRRCPQLEREIDDRRISLYQVTINGQRQRRPSSEQLLPRFLPARKIVRRFFEPDEVGL